MVPNIRSFKQFPGRSLRLAALVLSVTLGCMSAAALAQPFPNRPIQLIVPYTPGAGGDTIARLIAGRISPALGQPVVVVNRSGAAGALGTAAGAKAPPDGYTWTWVADAPLTIMPHVRTMPFSMEKDFVPLSLIARGPYLLVANPNVPARTVQEVVALAKSKPGGLVMASGGTGSPGHLAYEYLRATTGAEMLHVPYKGQAEALLDLAAGRANMNFSVISSAMAFLKEGRVRAIAIATDKRFVNLPDVPTFAEAGYPGFETGVFHGLVAPAGTPPAIVIRINEELSKVLKEPELVARLHNMGFEPVGGAPENLSRLISADSARWGKLIREANTVVSQRFHIRAS